MTQPENCMPEPLVIRFDDRLVRASSFQMATFRDVLRHCALLSMPDICKVLKAYDEARLIFTDQKRNSGEDYFEHVKAVTLIDILEFCNQDPDIMIAELHHDSLEFLRESNDHRKVIQYTLEKFANSYGQRVAKIIQCLTKSERKEERLNDSDFTEKNMRRVITLHPEERTGSAQVKACDGMHNNRTEVGSRKYVEKKTLEKAKFYLPIARFAGEAYYQKFREELSLKLLRLGLTMPPEHDFGIV